MAGDQGEGLGGGAVEPKTLPSDAGAGLVVGHHRGGHQPVAQVDQEVVQEALGLGKQARHPPRGDRHAHQVGYGLGSASHRQVLVGHQVGAHPRDHRAVGSRGGGLGREGPRGLAAAGTATGLHDVGGDHDLWFGDVEDLAGLRRDHLGAGQRSATARAHHGCVGHHGVGDLHLGQMGARGTVLLTLLPLHLSLVRPLVAALLLGLALGQGVA